MRRLALVLFPALLIGAYVVADTSPLIRAFTFSDGGHGFMAGTFEDDLSGDCSGGSYTSTSGHTLTCNNTTSTADDAFGFTQGVQDGKARWFDGSNDSLSIADGSGGEDFEFSDDFTVFVCVTPHYVTGQQHIIGKWNTTGNQRTWALQTNGTGVDLVLSADGTAVTTANKASVLAIGKMSCIVASYDKSAAEVNIWVDEATVDTTGSMSASLYDSTSPASIGTEGDLSSNPYLGLVHVAIADDVEYTADQAQRTIRHFRGLLSADGTNSVTVSSASPPMAMIAAPDSGVEPFLVPQPAHSTTIGPYGLYGASGTTNLVHRGVLETWAAGAPTGWGETGSGTWSVDQETGTMVEGLSSAKMTTGSAGGDYARLYSTCITCSDLCSSDPCNCDAYVSHWVKRTSGAGSNFRVQVTEYDTVACGTGLGTIDQGWQAPTSTYALNHFAVGSGDWNGATSSFNIRVTQEGTDQETYVDAVYVGIHDPDTNDSYCGSDAAAATTCNSVPNFIGNPFKDSSQKFRIEFTARTPWNYQTPSYREIFVIGATGGSTNNKAHAYIGGGAELITFRVANAAGNWKYWTHDMSGGTFWASDTDIDLVFQRDGSTSMAAWIDGAKFNALTHTPGVADDCYEYIGVFSTSVNGQSGWARNLKFYRTQRELP